MTVLNNVQCTSQSGCLNAAYCWSVPQPEPKQQVENQIRSCCPIGKPRKRQCTVHTDAGYLSETNVGHCLEHKVLPSISAGRDTHSQTLKQRFVETLFLPDNADCFIRVKQCLKSKDGPVLDSKRKIYC